LPEHGLHQAKIAPQITIGRFLFQPPAQIRRKIRDPPARTVPVAERQVTAAASTAVELS